MNKSIDDLLVSKKHKRQLMNATRRNSNRLFEEIIGPQLYDNETSSYWPHFYKKKGSFSESELEEIIGESEGEDLACILPNTQYFSNPLLFAKQGKEPAPDERRTKELPPSQRVTNSGYLVLTFEHDGDDVESLEAQLEWFLGKPESCLFSEVHKALSQYADYRGYCAVFSGHKSVHIHLVFDIRHLSKRLTKRHKGASELWKMDVPNDALSKLYRTVWFEVDEIIRSALQTELEFDQSLGSLFSKRRTPWGTYVCDKPNNIHDFKEGDTVTQIVVQEKVFTRASPNASETMFSAKKARKAIADLSKPKKKSCSQSISNVANPELLHEIKIYLQENGWPEYPKPVLLRYVNSEYILHFQNHAFDNNPSTIVKSNYGSLLVRGKGALSTAPQLPNKFTLTETIEICSQRLFALQEAVEENSIPYLSRPSSWPKKYALEAKDINSARSLQNLMLSNISDLRGSTLIQGLWGSGKTHSLMIWLQERRRDEDAARLEYGRKLSTGFIAIASPSYSQARQKCQEFLRLKVGNSNAVVLKSCSEIYREAIRTLNKKPLNRKDIGEAGHKNFLEGIRALQPEVYDKMFIIRDEMWKRGSRNLYSKNNSVFFTTHDLMKHWTKSRASKAFLNPNFPRNFTEEDVDNCVVEMSLYRVVYDELSAFDLVQINAKELVEIATRVEAQHTRLTSKPWDESSLTEHVQAYNSIMSNYKGLDFSFDDCSGIIRARYHKKDDLFAVNAQRFPLGKGTAEKNIYAKRDGNEYFCKKLDWWQNLGCPIVMLTTEDLPTKIFNSLLKQQLLEYTQLQTCLPPNKQMRTLSLMSAPNLFNEYVPVIFDEAARSPRVDNKDCKDLAIELLDNGVDFVIGNTLATLPDEYAVRTCTHISAKGRNDLKNKKLATILTYPSLPEYDRLNIIGVKFDIHDPIQLAYRDIALQDLGRNLGFRRVEDADDFPHSIYIKSSLYSDLHYFQKGSKVPFKFFNEEPRSCPPSVVEALGTASP